MSHDDARSTDPLSLESLKIASPCHESWASMVGDERKRFCERCELHVYNLSGMTRQQATDLVAEAEGKLCVRFHRRVDGSVLTRDCPVGLAARTSRFIKACAAGLLALLGFLPGCSADSPARGTGRSAAATGKEEPEIIDEVPPEEGEPEGLVIMGDMCVEELGEMVAPAEDEPVLMGKPVVPDEEIGKIAPGSRKKD